MDWIIHDFPKISMRLLTIRITKVNMKLMHVDELEFIIWKVIPSSLKDNTWIKKKNRTYIQLCHTYLN